MISEIIFSVMLLNVFGEKWVVYKSIYNIAPHCEYYPKNRILEKNHMIRMKIHDIVQ